MINSHIKDVLPKLNLEDMVKELLDVFQKSLESTNLIKEFVNYFSA